MSDVSEWVTPGKAKRQLVKWAERRRWKPHGAAIRLAVLHITNPETGLVSRTDLANLMHRADTVRTKEPA